MLNECPLFKGIPEEALNTLTRNRYTVQLYKSGELVAMQGSLYDHLLIVEHGSVRAEMTDTEGRISIIEEIHAPRVIAPAFVFASMNRLPVAVIAREKTDIIRIHKSTFTKMMQENEQVHVRYLTNMADRSHFLSEKLRMQRFGTIRSKMCRYLLDFCRQEKLYEVQNVLVKIPHTQQQLADMFGVTRPSLARCIAGMEQEGLLEVKGKAYRIPKMQKLSQYL